MDDIDELNEGLGEGCSYKGRVLVSVKTELLDNEMAGPSTVYRDKVKSSGSVSIVLHQLPVKFSPLYPW